MAATGVTIPPDPWPRPRSRSHQAHGRNRRLAVGDGAVVDWKPLRYEDPQARGVQAGRHRLQQPPILEHAPDRTIRSVPWPAARPTHVCTVASQTAAWNRVAITPAATPAARSPATAAIVGRGSISAMPPA